MASVKARGLRLVLIRAEHEINVVIDCENFFDCRKKAADHSFTVATTF